MNVPKGYTRLFNLSSPKGLDEGNPTLDLTGKNLALIYVENQDVRWRDDGTDPSLTHGMLQGTGTILMYDGDLKAIKFIELAAGAVLQISLYKTGG